ncbi:enoyl-CoA hydratase-related protein [Sporichthya polymorpha]|uniref:enoyl-CoA hydratase-related protein n=1 Tax=Sporichthya polymorpha TaxID=35751 RepID=UPI000372CEB0|nr:enoyl-CoA hydratase-related protein [Sporichthya polymorpha]
MIKEIISSDGVAELVLDNPPVNALCLADIAELTGRFRSYADKVGVRAVVLRAEGRGFCAGGDVKEIQRLPGFEGIVSAAHAAMALTLSIDECAVPVIAAVHGYCVGLGVLIAGVCDIVLSAPTTPFVLAEVNNGAASGIVQALGLMPEKRLRAALFTAEPVYVEELLGFGSVLRIEPADRLAESARRVAQTIARKNPAVLRALKVATDGSLDRGLRARYRQELSATYELNMAGAAQALREDFVSGRRTGHVSRLP